MRCMSASSRCRGTFELTVPLYVVLMSVLGGSRQLVRAGDRRHRHHRAALCLHQRRRGDDRPRHRRRDPDLGHPLAARRRRAGRAEVAGQAPAALTAKPPAARRSRRSCRRAKPIGDRGHAARCAASPSASAACRRWAASISTCARARSSGLVGPNGSGKTTLINVISGFYPLTSGSIAVDGVADRPPAGARDRRPRRGAHLPDPAAVREHDRAGERRAGRDLRRPGRGRRRKSATRRCTGSASPALPARRTCCRPG